MACLAVGGAIAPHVAQAAGLLIADGGLGGVLEIRQHEVSVVINNGIAVTEVRQVFHNTEQRAVEALYTFPVPAGASVSNFSMIINGQEMVGEVVEKQRARQIYNSYKQVRRDPGLLEQTDYKTFELRVFPIPANADQHIKVTYCQQLDFDHDNATYVYPLATVTRKGIDQKARGKFALTLDVKSEIPITRLFSPSHADDFVVSNPNENYARASYEVQEGSLDRDLVVSFDTSRPRTGIDLITSKQSGEEGFFLLTMTAGQELEEYGAGMDYVFVVDISGSMQHEGKLMQSKRTVSSFLQALGQDDRFEVITFNDVPKPHFGQLTVASTESREQGRAFLDSEKARGGTVLRPALNTAYRFKDQDRPLNVVLLSDGMTDQREQNELLQLMKAAPAGTRVFCIGIGNEVNRPLLKQLAEGAGGLAAFVSQEDDFGRQASAFRRKLMRPVATNVRISIDGGAIHDVSAEKLPDLFYGAPLRIYGRYGEPGLATITLHAEVMGQPITQTTRVELPAQDDRNPEIERMWAFQKVEQEMAALRDSGPSEARVQKIVQLCEGFSIAGEYASFIVLENDAEYKRWAIERRNAIRVKRDDASRIRLRDELQRQRDESLAKLGPVTPEPAAAPKQLAVNTPSNPSAASPTSPQGLPQSLPPVTQPSPPASNSIRPTYVPDNSGSSWGGSGGGALDPLTATLALSLAAAAGATRRKKRPARSAGE
jgi:Ca-activated chloride channel family protein